MGKKQRILDPLPQQTDKREDLFDNAMVRSAYKALSPEERANYKKMGEHMFNSVDFADSEIINNMPQPLNESAAYILSGIQSGLLPSCLDANEKMLLNEVYGEKWYEKYGYTEDDLD